MHAVRTASRHPVCRITFSPCGGWFAAAQPHHGVTLHDRPTGEAVRTFGNGRRADYTSVAFLPDGSRVAACGSKGLELFDAATGECLAAAHREPFRSLRLGFRGGMILAGGTRAVMELRLAPGEDLNPHWFWDARGVVHLHAAPDGRWAVGFCETQNPVAVDLAARRVAHTLSHPARATWYTHARDLPAVAFAATGSRVAVGDGASVGVFDLDPAAELHDTGDVPAPRPVGTATLTLPPPDGWPPGRVWRPPFALTPDGRGLLVKRPRERVQLWDVNAGSLEAEWSWRLEGITCLAVAPDGLTAVAGGRFGRVLTWDLE